MSNQQTQKTITPETRDRVESFLYRETDLLDNFELEDWLALLTDDVMLSVPVRASRDPGSEQDEFSSRSYYLKEDIERIHERVGRLQKEYAWSENPRSRVRHVVGNVRILEADGNELTVSNNQHVFRSYGDKPDYDLISAQRHTVLRETQDGYRIADRTVYLDHIVLNTKNITLPLL